MHPKTIALQARTQTFAADVVKLCDALPKDAATQRIVSQLVDSSGATDSNYRATCRARSKSEFIAKLGVAIEEADESKGWLELLIATNRASIEQTQALIQEANELLAIFVASRKTAERRKRQHDLDEKQLRGTNYRRAR
jgi:four helix bundle protein